MRSRRRVVCGFAFLSLLACGIDPNRRVATRSPEAEDNAAVDAASRAFVAALLRGDVEAAASLTAEDVVLSDANGAPRAPPEQLRYHIRQPVLTCGVTPSGSVAIPRSKPASSSRRLPGGTQQRRSSRTTATSWCGSAAAMARGGSRDSLRPILRLGER